MRAFLLLLVLPVMAAAQMLSAIVGAADSSPYAIPQASGVSAGNMGISTAVMRAQSFTPPVAMHVNSITLKLLRTNTGGHVDNVVVALYTSHANGTQPSATVMQTSSTTLVGSTMATSATSYTFQFTSVALAAGTKYWIVLSRSGSVDATNYYQFLYSAGGDVYSGGGLGGHNGTAWNTAASAQDMVFTVTGVTP